MTFDVEKERLEAEKRYTDLINQIGSLETSLETLSIDIEETNRKIRQINSDVITTKQEIDENSKTIEELKLKIEENREILLDYLVYIYKKSNTAYE
jgi:peptidoglycan hydrolase CwlO-like protein